MIYQTSSVAVACSCGRSQPDAWQAATLCCIVPIQHRCYIFSRLGDRVSGARKLVQLANIGLECCSCTQWHFEGSVVKWLKRNPYNFVTSVACEIVEDFATKLDMTFKGFFYRPNIQIRSLLGQEIIKPFGQTVNLIEFYKR